MEFLYIYNIEQCSFYMRHNVHSIDCGIHPESKMVWHKYIKEETKDVYPLWLDQCKRFKEGRSK